MDLPNTGARNRRSVHDDLVQAGAHSGGLWFARRVGRQSVATWVTALWRSSASSRGWCSHGGLKPGTFETLGVATVAGHNTEAP